MSIGINEIDVVRDRGDVRNLLATGYDAGYFRRWTRELGLDTLLEECLE